MGMKKIFEGAKKIARGTIEGGKKIGKKIAETEMFKNVSGISREWRGKLAGFFSAGTLEKWQMLGEKKAENMLIKMKDGEIDQMKREIEEAKRKIEKIKDEIEGEEKNHQTFPDDDIQKLADEDLQRKRDKASAEIKRLEDSIPEMEGQVINFSQQKEEYQKRIERIKNDFIITIKEKIRKTTEDQEARKVDQKRCDVLIDELSQKITEEEDAFDKKFGVVIKQKDGWEEEPRKKLEEMIGRAKKAIDEKKKELERVRKKRDIAHRRIDKNGRDLEAYRKLEAKYGIV